VDGFVVTDDAVIETFMARLIALAAEKHLPAIYGFSTAPKLGGLMSYSADFFAMWRRNAGYVDRILKGARPADLPIEQATEVVLNINLKTAKALGLNVPQDLLVTANELIE
jgi:putative tryptophan/tyrosine transport system substrate-binding protein